MIDKDLMMAQQIKPYYDLIKNNCCKNKFFFSDYKKF